jgi:hypothetical protein
VVAAGPQYEVAAADGARHGHGLEQQLHGVDLEREGSRGSEVPSSCVTVLSQSSIPTAIFPSPKMHFLHLVCIGPHAHMDMATV